MSSRNEKVRVGTSGWSYKEWEGIFYPDSKTPKLTFYSKIFETAEIDSTFYANPSKGLVLGWVRNTPEDFTFSLKLPKTITHDKMLDLSKGAEIDLVKFIDLISPLKDSGKIGPLLIQLPPKFGKKNRNLLQEFLDALPKDHLFAIEFRNKSWLDDPELFPLLKRYNVANTVVDEPLMPVNLTVTSREFAFVRWHGRGKLPWYNYRYSVEELDPWVQRTNEILKNTKRVYGYFNNHFHANAVENGLEFLQRLGLSTKEQSEMLEDIKKRRAGITDRSQTTLAEY